MKSRSVCALVCALSALLLPLACKSSDDKSGGGDGGNAQVAAVIKNIDTHVAAAAARKPSDVKIPWDLGTTLNKPQAIKRFGRFIRNNLWGKLEKISQDSVTNGDQELLAMGYFYLAYCRARDIGQAKDQAAVKEEVLDMVLKAVDLGYRNPHEIKNSKPLLPLHDLPKFQSSIAELETEFNEGLRNKTKAYIDEEITRSGTIEQAGWKPEIKTLTGDDVWLDQQQLVFVSRIHHDGFDKLYPVIARLAEKHGDKLAISVIFYQYDLTDADRQGQMQKYMDKLGVKLPCAVIGRDDYKKLTASLDDRHKKLDAGRKKSAGPFNPFQPLGLFMTKENKPIYLSRGVVAEWELEYVAEQFLKATGS